jgi:hypothetical protein
MTARLTQDNSSWLADWGLLAAAGETLPPRDPNDDDEEDEEDEEDEDGNEAPPVVREPDE